MCKETSKKKQKKIRITLIRKRQGDRFISQDPPNKEKINK